MQDAFISVILAHSQPICSKTHIRHSQPVNVAPVVNMGLYLGQ